MCHRPRLSSRLLSSALLHEHKRTDTMSSSFEPVVSTTINAVIPHHRTEILWRVIEDETADGGEACAGTLEPDQQKISCTELGILYRVPAAPPLRRVLVGII